MGGIDSLSRGLLIASFQEKLNIRFKNSSLLDVALTHRSCANEKDNGETPVHNERLEFLGDAVLGQVVASILYEKMLSRPEGDLSRIKSIVVSEAVLANLAEEIGIPSLLRLGKGEELSGGRKKRAILADALEALIGAVFLDAGHEGAQAFVRAIMEAPIRRALAGPSKDHKTVIQEYAQKYLQTLPRYTLESTQGPEHAHTFWVSCMLGLRKFGPYAGSTKKEAEQNAAKELFEALKSESASICAKLEEIAQPR
jgi:ribonuclease-3